MPQFVGFLIFLIAVFAETNRLPFDLAEAEAELVAGFHTEYSAFKFGMFFMGEYANIIAASGLVVTLYFGGWSLPGIAFSGVWEPSPRSPSSSRRRSRSSPCSSGSAGRSPLPVRPADGPGLEGPPPALFPPPDRRGGVRRREMRD